MKSPDVLLVMTSVWFFAQRNVLMHGSCGSSGPTSRGLQPSTSISTYNVAARSSLPVSIELQVPKQAFCKVYLFALSIWSNSMNPEIWTNHVLNIHSCCWHCTRVEMTELYDQDHNVSDMDRARAEALRSAQQQEREAMSSLASFPAGDESGNSTRVSDLLRQVSDRKPPVWKATKFLVSVCTSLHEGLCIHIHVCVWSWHLCIYSMYFHLLMCSCEYTASLSFRPIFHSCSRISGICQSMNQGTVTVEICVFCAFIHGMWSVPLELTCQMYAHTNSKPTSKKFLDSLEKFYPSTEDLEEDMEVCFLLHYYCILQHGDILSVHKLRIICYFLLSEPILGLEYVSKLDKHGVYLSCCYGWHFGTEQYGWDTVFKM